MALPRAFILALGKSMFRLCGWGSRYVFVNVALGVIPILNPCFSHPILIAGRTTSMTSLAQWPVLRTQAVSLLNVKPPSFAVAGSKGR